MNLTQIAQWINQKPLGHSRARKGILIAISIGLLYPLMWSLIPYVSHLPFIAVALTWVWFTLPGLVLSLIVIKNLSWFERIPVSFGLSIGIYTPIILLAIFLQLNLSIIIWLYIAINSILVITYAFLELRSEPGVGPNNVAARTMLVPSSYALIAFIVIFAGILAFISIQWPPAGDDISGLPIFSEVLRLDYITASEPFHGSGTPSTPRNELITWTYQNIINNRVSGVSPVDHFVNTRPVMILLAFLGMFSLLHQYFKKTQVALFLLSFWSVYLLATTKIEGLGSNLITRIFQDKFVGWFVIVPVLLVLMLWYLKGHEWRYLIGFAVAALGATLVHPITMTQFMIIAGAFCLFYLIVDRSLINLKSVGWTSLIIAFCLGILIIQYLRYQGYAPVELAGLGDAVEFSRIRMAVSRYRLWLLEGDQYILHPSIVLQPIILLGFLLLPALFRDYRKNNGAMLILSSMFIFPVILFIPMFAGLVGRLVTPYLLWRLAWPLETFAVLSIGWAAWLLLEVLNGQSARFFPRMTRYISYTSSLVVILLAMVVALPNIEAGMVNLRERFVEVDYSLCLLTVDALEYLDQLSYEQPVNVLASQSLNFCIPGFAPRANVVEYRGLGTVNRLPEDQISASLQRVEDAHYFSKAIRVDDVVVDIIKKYEIDYILLEKDRLAMDLQLRYLPDMFSRVYEDENVTLYSIADPLPESDVVLANAALREREWENAQRGFESIIRRDADQPLAYYGLGEALEGQGQIVQALEQYINANNSAENEASLHSRVAGTHLLLNDVSSANEEYLQAIDLQPEIPSLYTSLARSYLLGGSDDLAREYFEQGAEFKVSKGSALYHTILAKQLADVGWFSQAIESYKTALILEPDPLRHVALGKVYSQIGDIPQAIDQFEEAIRIDPWLFIAHLQLGGIYDQQREKEAAIHEYEMAWRLNPTYNSSYILLGQSIQEEHGTEAAIARLQSLTSLNDVLPGPHRGLAPLYVSNNQREIALEELDFCAAIQPKDASIQAAIGYLLLAGGYVNEAQQAYESALIGNPDLISGRMGLSSLYALDAESGPEIGQLYQIIRNEPTLSWPHLSLASAYQKLGLWDDVEREIRWAIKLSPENAEGYVLLGNLYRSRSDWDLAISTFEEALEVDPNNTDALVQLAQIYQSRSDMNSARELLEQAVEVNQQDAFALMKLSEVYWSLGLFDKSTETKEAAVNVDPDSGYALMLLADSYYQEGRIEDANYLYQRAIQVEPSLIAAYSAEAQLETEMDNNWDAASALFSTAIETNPSSSIAHLVAGRFFQQRGMFDEAESAFQTGLSLPSITEDNFLALSDLYVVRGDWQSAEDMLHRAASAFPAAPNVYKSIGDFYLARGDVEEAQENYEKAINLDSTYIAPYVGLSRIYQYSGKAVAAEQLLADATIRNPFSSEALIALAGFYENQEEFLQAESLFQEAIDIAPSELNTYLTLSEFYQRRGRFDESLEVLQKAEFIPSHTIELYLDIASTQLGLHEQEAAIQTLESAVPFDRSDPRAYLKMADIYLSMGNMDRALESLNRAIEANPNDVQANIALGSYYQQLALFDKAEGYFKHAASYDRSNSEALLALSNLYSIDREWEKAIGVLEEALDSTPTEAEVYSALGKIYHNVDLNVIADSFFSQGIQNSLDKSRALSLRAGFYLEQGKWEQARTDLEEVWRRNPGSQIRGLQLANHLISRGDHEAALEILEQLALSPNTNAQVYIAMGNIHSIKANWTEATNAFHQAIQFDGENTTEAYAGFARIQQLQGNYDEALKLYQSATEAAPLDPQAWINLGDAYQDQLKYSDAYEAYASALELDFSNVNALIGLDNLSHKSTGLGQDPPDLQSLVNAAPSVLVSRALAVLYQSRGEWDSAEYWHKYALRLDPYDGTNWLNLANYHRALEQWDLAYEALNDGIKYHPSSSTLHVTLGGVQEALGLNEAALVSYQSAIELDPSRFEGYEAMANLQIKSGNADEGLETMVGWLQSVQGSYRGYAALGKIYAEQGQTDRAIETFQAGLAHMPGVADLYVNIGNLYGARILEVTDNLADAEAFERSIQYRIEELQERLLPELNRKQSRVSELRLINVLEIYSSAQNRVEYAQFQYNNLAADLEAAKTAYESALELEPSNEAALLGLGRINLAYGNTEQAQEYFRAASAVNPNSLIALNFLGNAFLDSGKPEDAAEVFENILVLDPANTFGHAGLFTAYNKYEHPNLAQVSAIVEHGQFSWDNLINYLRVLESN